MRTHGVIGDEQPLRDVVGAEVLVEQEEHLELAGAENARDRVRHAVAPPSLSHLVEQPARDAARERRLPVHDAAEELDDPLGRLRLQQIARGAGPDRRQQVLLCPGGGEDDDLGLRCGGAQVRERGESVHAGHREVEQDEIGLEALRKLDRLSPVGRRPDDRQPVLAEQCGERVARQRVVVDDQDPHSPGLSAATLLPKRVTVRSRAKDPYESWLWGELLLVSLLGAALTLFVTEPGLRNTYSLPQARLVLDTTVMLAAAIVAVLTAVRFAVDGRRLDLLLCIGFAAEGATTLLFAITPVLGGGGVPRAEAWSAVGGTLVAASLIAAAPFAGGRITRRREVGWLSVAALAALLFLIWAACRSVAGGLPALVPAHADDQPLPLTVALSAQALLGLIALVGFGLRLRARGEDLDRWLGLGATLGLFAELHYVFTPLLSSSYVSPGDFLRLLSFGVLLVGVWRAISFAEFGRAVAEERARVAREIHDGLAQYLFAVSTHVSMLEGGAAVTTTLPALKAAAAAAQQEARFAVLALSSASGSAPFDAALRRYVDVLTADGAIEVDLEIESGVRLGPDEQIEVFRIVQEGLANARKHARASRVQVAIGHRAGRRYVSIRDDGAGFDVDVESGGQGLRNIGARAASIGGAFRLDSRPGAGTALEVTLRA